MFVQNKNREMGLNKIIFAGVNLKIKISLYNTLRRSSRCTWCIHSDGTKNIKSN